MKEVIINYKTRILLILLTGFFIVSVITAIAGYSIYKNTLLEYNAEADKIIKIYETNYNNIIKDLEYLKLIDFLKSDEDIIQQFKKIATLVYDQNHFINGIGLVKQFPTEAIKEEQNKLVELSSNKDIDIFPIVDLLENASPAKKDDLYSVLFYRLPQKVEKDIIGAELSSEHNRQVIIASMNFTDRYYLTAPVGLVNDGLKGFKYSSVLYYPLFKEENGKYYKWFVTVPMTSQKILNSFLKEYYNVNDFTIHIYDRSDNHDKKHICICSNKEEVHPSQVGKYIIKSHMYHFANRERKMLITVDELFVFDRYWTVVLGFLSGMFFLIGIGYYLFYKERKEMQIKQLSRTDHLTQVYNRIYFDEQIEHFIEQNKRYEQQFSLILLDIDHFKKINDTFGHTKGDEVLIQLSKLILSSIRKSDMIARWGGEEFAILLPNTSLELATEIATKLRKKIEHHTFCTQFNVTCSFGVTQIEEQDKLVTLFNRADSALYKAKENGRNRIETV